jgi:hypothetical protein
MPTRRLSVIQVLAQEPSIGIECELRMGRLIPVTRTKRPLRPPGKQLIYGFLLIIDGRTLTRDLYRPQEGGQSFSTDD